MDTVVLSLETSKDFGYIPRKEYWDTCRNQFKVVTIADEV
jgi:hypothetical protein